MDIGDLGGYLDGRISAESRFRAERVWQTTGSWSARTSLSGVALPDGRALIQCVFSAGESE